MQLIDLNTVLEEIEDTVTSVSFCGTVEAARSAHETKDRILSRVKDLPTIDAVPVVHGYWKLNHEKEWCCSACGYAPVVHEGANYCGCCGAKMDLEGTDADKT
jgi:hypothetical protein